MRRGGASRAALIVACGLACARCATIAATGETATSGRAWRAVGSATLRGPELTATIDVALTWDDERARLDMMLPTGMPAAIAWLDAQRWLLLDPAAGVAWHGSVREVVQAWPHVGPDMQAALAIGFGMSFWQDAPRFARIWQWRDAAPTVTATTVSGGGAVWFGDGTAWRVDLRDVPAGDSWPRTWRATRTPWTLEVVWQRFDPLPESERQLLTPRVPASYAPRSLSQFLPLPDAPANANTAPP